MPSSMSGILGKVMGPLQTALGIGMSVFGGPAGIAAGAPLALSGLNQTLGPTGFGGSPSQPGATPPTAPVVATSGAPPSAPPTIGPGLSLTNPIASASTSPDAMSQGIASNIMANDPFSIYNSGSAAG